MANITTAHGYLRRLRLNSGKSLRRAEKDLGLVHGQLSDFETGRRRLPMLLVAPMALAYSTPECEVTVTEVLFAAEKDWRAREDRLAREEQERSQAEAGGR